MARFRVVLLVLTSLTACTSAVYRVEENVPHGTVVYEASGDDGSNYRFQEEDGFFSISDSGEIRTNGTLDREAVVDKYGTDTVTYTINYLVDSKKSSLEVSIQVDDVNDNAPQFDNLPPSINVGSNAQGQIWPLSATDPDRGANSTVDFEIVSGNQDGFFEITHLVGDASRKRLSLTMSPPTGRTFSLVLKAEDQGTPTRLSNNTNLQVNISSIANDAPVFAQSSYNFLVPLSAVVGRSIGIVSAVDPDSNLNASIVYYFDESDTSYSQATRYFSINASTGILRLRSSPNQQVIRVSFLVYARNTLTVTGVELTSSVPVFVRFYRGNDIPQIVLVDNNNPVPPTIHVLENLPYFTLESMLVLDDDRVVNTSVLVSPEIDYEFNTLVLSFGGTNAELNFLTFNITGPIDREEVPVINITLMATDAEGATGSVTIQVKIDDENDNDPRFDNGGEYHFKVEETLEVGTVVGRVNATDPDFGSNGTVEYAVTSVSPSQAEGLFSLERSTGEVVPVRLLNYEDENLRRITFSIEAYDLGLYRRVANASIIIDVLDVNEPPTFAPDALTEIDIMFDMTVPRTLSTFMASDDDDLDQVIIYELSCSEDVNNFLEINQNAELRLIRIPQVVPSPINCTVKSSDNSGHFSSLDVTLFYIDDHCSSDPCRNNATCSPTRSEFHCECLPLYGGERCDLPRDPCDIYSCENNATCSGTALSHDYNCYCMRGYSGKRCEIGPISFTGKGYAVYPSLQGDDDLTSFSLEVSTRDSYGLLFYKPFEDNAFVSLEIVQDKVVLKDTRVSTSTEIVNSTILSRSGSWYMIAVVYTSGQPSLSVEVATSNKVTMDATTGPSDARSYQVLGGISDISKVQLSKLSAFDFFGCIGNVVVNNKLLDLSKSSTSSSNFKVGCDPATPSLLSASHCVDCDGISDSACSYIKRRLLGTCTEDTLLKSFNGLGYVQLDLEDAFFFYAWVLQQGQDGGLQVARETIRNSNYKISLNFATSKTSGILFAISNNQSYHVLMITATNLAYFIHHSSRVQPMVVALEGNYHDNKWHTVTIRVTSTTNGNFLKVSTERDTKTKQLLSDVGVSLTSGVTKFYVGGVSSVLSRQILTTSSSLTVKPIEGCISNLTVNNMLIPLDSSIDGVVVTTSPDNPFNGDTSTCPNNKATTLDDLNIYLAITMPATVIILLLILVSIIVAVMCCCRYHCSGHKSTFRVDSQNSIGGQSSMMHYHDEAGEFHPDEKEEKEENYHLRQTSIDSPAVNGMRQHLASSTSQETGFHEPPLLHGGSSTDIKSEFSDADESTQPHSDDDNRTRDLRAKDHLKRQRMKMRRTDPRQRCDSLTSTEEQIIKPIQIRESDIRTPSLENVLDIKNSVFISHPRPKVPSPITPLHFQEGPLQSLSVPRVTPNHYWEEASRMKPAVDTEDHNLRLSQLKNEPFWVMDPPSSSTSVVSSAVDDHLIGLYRQGEFLLQGGMEEEGGIDNLSHHTEDSLNRFGRVHRHRHPFDGSQQRPLWSLLRKPPYFHPAQVPGHLPPQRPLTSNTRPFSPPKYPGVFPSSQPQSPRRVPKSPNEFSGLHSSHSSGGIPKAYSIRETPSGQTSRGICSPQRESPNLHPESGENPRGMPTKGSGYQHHSQDYPSPETYKNDNAKVVSPKITLADLANRSRKGEQVDLNQYLSRDPYPSFSQPVSGDLEDHQFDRLLPYVVKHPSLDGRRGNYCKTNSETQHLPVDV